MAVYQDREAFIPYSRTDIIELCLEDGQLADEDVQKFRDFCQILAAYYHFRFHQTLETLKDNFAPFNPDATNQFLNKPLPEQLKNMEIKVVATFETLLERANYVLLSPKNLQRAFQEKSLIELKTSVDFDELDQMVCYCCGDTHKVISIKKLWRKVQKSIEVFERVALLIKFKDEAYFNKKGVNTESFNFIPGKMYIYLYKNVPKFDLELLFPNIKISMTWKDRLLLVIPAIGAAIPLTLKILPQLLLIIAAILFFTVGPSVLETVNASEEEVRNIMPVLVATLSLLVTLGGFAFKQYSSYKSKQIKFQKKVTETLFFKNMANNAGVFQSLIDIAEEEECKEIILVYYHLLTSSVPLAAEQLDDQIEEWMDNKFGHKIDFDIQGPINNLKEIRGKVTEEATNNNQTQGEISLLDYDDRGHCQVLPLDEAKRVIDYVWDNAFLYSRLN
ncbi:MAG: TMEM143 family protein [Coleofasciculaceae cyanobacterium]